MKSTAVPPPGPPAGCPIFQPPARGAFVCISTEDQIYCSVICNEKSEFSAYPLNPYTCGANTMFEWRDIFNVFHSELPQCSGNMLCNIIGIDIA